MKPGDVPPVWDGKEPQKNVRTYLKLLNIWLKTTRTRKDCQGYVLLNASKGELRELYDGIDEDELASERCPEVMIALVKEMFAQFLKRPIPEVVENALYDQAKTNRKGGETMALYIQRRVRYWKELEKEKIKLPDECKCYLLYRGAQLNTTAVDTIQTWTQGKWDLEEMKSALIKLEHHTRGGVTLHGQHKSHTHFSDTTLVAYGGDAGPDAGTAGLPTIAEDDCYIFISECYWTSPDSYDDDLLAEFAECFYDSDAIFVPDDWLNVTEFDEDDVVTILANYGQVRKYLSDKAKARGFFSVRLPGKGKGKGHAHKMISNRPAKGKGKGKGKQRHARPVRSSKKWLISRSKCARCGQIGHWARTCTNTPDARGAAHHHGHSKAVPKRKALTGFTAGFCVAGDPLPIEDQKEVGDDREYTHLSLIAPDMTIFANYGQVRKYLTDKAKARGFFNVRPPSSLQGRD